MDYSTTILIFSTNLTTFLASIWYFNNRYKNLKEAINYNKVADQILQARLVNIERDLEKMENFKFKILEKNVVIKENRAWDYIETDDDEDDEDDEDEEEFNL